MSGTAVPVFEYTCGLLSIKSCFVSTGHCHITLKLITAYPYSPASSTSHLRMRTRAAYVEPRYFEAERGTYTPIQVYAAPVRSTQEEENTYNLHVVGISFVSIPNDT